MIIDTHAHLYFDNLKARFDEVLEKAFLAGVSHIINIGVDINTSLEAIKQVKQNHSQVRLYATIGLHPHDSSDPALTEVTIKNHIADLRQLYLENKDSVVGVGECGLDFYSGSIPGSRFSEVDFRKTKNLQKKLFEAQIKLATELKLPLIIHCRDAWEEMFNHLSSFQGILHCYSGDSEVTKKVLDSNLYISFAANITYPKNDYLRVSATLIPLERILIETDSPFLSPQSKRGQTNEPANVLEVAKCLAEIKGVSLEEVALQTSLNALRVFKLANH